MADLRTCTHVVTPNENQPLKGPENSPSLTLYPAAYPRPGNNEVNFLPAETLAESLKMTLFNSEADFIWHDQRTFSEATVLSGFK